MEKILLQQQLTPFSPTFEIHQPTLMVYTHAVQKERLNLRTFEKLDQTSYKAYKKSALTKKYHIKLIRNIFVDWTIQVIWW